MNVLVDYMEIYSLGYIKQETRLIKMLLNLICLSYLPYCKLCLLA